MTQDEVVVILRRKIRARNIIILLLLIFTISGIIFFINYKEGIDSFDFYAGPPHKGGPIDPETANQRTKAYRKAYPYIYRHRASGLYHDTTSLNDYISKIYSPFVNNQKAKDGYEWQLGFAFMVLDVNRHKTLSLCLNPIMVNKTDSTNVIDYFSAKQSSNPTIEHDTIYFVINNPTLNNILIANTGSSKLFYDNGQLWP